MLSEEEVLRRRQELEERRAWKRRYRRRQIIFYSLFFALGTILMIFTARYTYFRQVAVTQADGVEEGRLLVLFLGTDNTIEASSRADTIMLLSVDTKSGEVGVLSIPRDTRVWSPSRQRWDRINALYAHGGTNLVMEAVAQLVRVPVRYYVHTDFEGFQDLVDILGGVEITVEKRMHYVDKAQGLEIDLYPGTQVLDGAKALQYVRYRDTLGDVSLVDPFGDQYGGRVERQRKFVEALAAKMLSSAGLVKLPQLITQMFKIVDTNLPLETMLSLAVSAGKFSAANLRTAVLPGNSQVLNDAWYWIVNEQKAAQVIDTVVLGKPEPLKLVVLNGNGRAGIAGQVSDLLREYGYTVVSTGNAEHFNHASTLVMTAPRNAERVKPLAEFLGASIQEVEGAGSEVTVIIGKDFTLNRERSVGI
ncbi:MAG TPA: LCP family protein [Limnochordia bacterium]|nr:LCP family protein [Limnochordia bacterium]